MQLSLIELGAVAPGQSGAEAVQNMIHTAQQVEDWGYSRYWLAEHHNTANFISRAPEVTIPLIAANTSQIRGVAVSVLLDPFRPFSVAEVLSLLSDVFPGRVGMGIGRATTGPVGHCALQRNRGCHQRADDSEEQLTELVDWLT